jgi:hypothetical protein
VNFRREGTTPTGHRRIAHNNFYRGIQPAQKNERERGGDSHDGHPDFFEALPAAVSSVLPGHDAVFHPFARSQINPARMGLDRPFKFRFEEKENKMPEHQLARTAHFLDHFPELS